MASSLITYYGNDPDYLAIVWQLAQITTNAGDAPVFMQLTGVLNGVGDSTNRRALGSLHIPSPDVAFTDSLVSQGYEVIRSENVNTAGQELPLSDDALEGIRETTRSALISYSRDPLPATNQRMWRTLERQLGDAALRTYAAVRAVLRDRPDIESVVFHNGRFPHQRAVQEAAIAEGRAVRHYEKGEKPNTYWFSPHSTLDREATQGSVDQTLAHLSDDQARTLGREWMARRSARGSANIYSRFFDDVPKESDDSSASSSTIVGLFTSSQDEFAALGPEWHVQSWQDQWTAFDHVLTHLEPFGYSFYLRVHPNFATKSHASFDRERAALLELGSKHPSLRIIWHDEAINSYALVDDTDVVIVWDSTIGLEASGRGKPVWELAASYYDLYADVRQWFGPADAPTAGNLVYPVDVSRAERFMAYLDIREPDLSPEAIAVRQSIESVPSRRLRVVNLVSSGGAPTARIALSSIVDAARHRRSAVNMRAARAFVASDTAR